MASLVLYDNYARSLREFSPLAPGSPVGLYTCGPTVYDYQHIGNYHIELLLLHQLGRFVATARTCDNVTVAIQPLVQ